MKMAMSEHVLKAQVKDYTKSQRDRECWYWDTVVASHLVTTTGGYRTSNGNHASTSTLSVMIIFIGVIILYTWTGTVCHDGPEPRANLPTHAHICSSYNTRSVHKYVYIHKYTY